MDKLGRYDLNSIVTGDAAQLMAALPEACIDLTVTSPPYDLVDYDDDGNLVTYPKKGLREYKGYTWDFAAIAAELYRVTKPGGVVVWVVGDATVDGSETGTSFRQALGFMGMGWRLHDTMIYEKNGVSYPDQVRYYQCFEYMFIFSKGQPKTVHLLKDRKNRWRCGSWGKKSSRKKDGGLVSRERYTSNKFGVRFNIWRFNTGRGYSQKMPVLINTPPSSPKP